MLKQSILIVDDERDTRELMARALGETYNVTTAPDAEQAMAALDADPSIALMLSDIRMPGADGLALLKAAKRKYPQLICILLTAFGTIDQAVAAMRDGAEVLCVRNGLVPNEGFSGVYNENTWYFNAAAATATADDVIFACDTYDVQLLPGKSNCNTFVR